MNRSKETGFADRQSAAAAAKKAALERYQAVANDPGLAERQRARDAVKMARDARILVDGGYQLGVVTPVDQFRYSAHVEVVARFARP